MLIVDAGNIFFPRSVADTASDEQKIAAQAIAKAYVKMGYQAIGLHPRDLLGGPELLEAIKNTGLPVVSANLYDDNKQQIFPSYILGKIGGMQVAVVGITGSVESNGLSNLDGFAIRDWRESLKAAVTEAAANSSLVILLSSLTDEENKQAVSLFPQVKLIFTADPRQGSQQPLLIEDCLLTQVASRGKYFGKLDITFAANSRWEAPPDKEMRAKQLQNRIKSANEQIVALGKKKSAASDAVAVANKKKLARLTTYKKQLESELVTLTKEIEDTKQNQLPVNRYEVVFLPVHPVRSGTSVDGIMDEFREQKHQLQSQVKGDLFDQAEKDKLLLSKFVVGSVKCASCHEAQATFWQSTRHSHAYLSLQKNGNERDLNCLPCHVNGGSITLESPANARQLLLSLSSERVNVGCEVCHGPGNAHSASPSDNKVLMKLPPKELCLVCHTKERDANFNYSTKLALIRCPSA